MYVFIRSICLYKPTNQKQMNKTALNNAIGGRDKYTCKLLLEKGDDITMQSRDAEIVLIHFNNRR